VSRATDELRPRRANRRRAPGVYCVLVAQAEVNVRAAWERAGRDAIASHVTALALYDLGDAEPRWYEFTVPRSARSRRPGRVFRLHTAKEMPPYTLVHGIPVTTPARSIVDCAPLGDLTEIAVAQALGRGLATEEELKREADQRPRRTRSDPTGANTL
jgi:predicted transcriptional regulator of viral defense system